MYKRIIILSAIIGAALLGFTLLGYHAIEKWAEALKWKEFAEAAELIRQDVERKLDDFIEAEENRPYSHYQYYYVLEGSANNQEQMLLQRSPLAGRMDNGLAYGNFQIEPDGRIVTANDYILDNEAPTIRNTTIHVETQLNVGNLRSNLLPELGYVFIDSTQKEVDKNAKGARVIKPEVLEKLASAGAKLQEKSSGKSMAFERRRGANYAIATLQRQDRQAQVIPQQRAIIWGNASANTIRAREQISSPLWAQTTAPVETEEARAQTQASQYPSLEESLLTSGIQQDSEGQQLHRTKAPRTGTAPGTLSAQNLEQVEAPRKDAPQTANPDDVGQMGTQEQLARAQSLYATNGLSQRAVINLASGIQTDQSDTVKVRQEPFKVIVTGGEDAEESVFGKQVFLVRDVKIEDTHIRQGFKLNEGRLIEEVRKSAAMFIRKGMSYELPQIEGRRKDNGDVAYTAILDFGFGYLILHLKETIPELIVKQASQLRNWYFSIVGIVFLAVTLAMLSLWRYARAQMKLAEKKDDFISAVSHEFRTPLTSIRMYSEMLEKNWVKSQDKLTGYYRSMRQESERLSRLIENVLDFSRIQKGRKKYAFTVGDLNNCISGVVEMMTPYAAQHGFSIKMELEQLRQTTFDNDAVKQIIVNLLDNAIKYARDAEDKSITVRTRSDTEYILIEVEDHGPGVPHRQRKKIFEEFYRLGSEATRETTGTGLGLALVKKFAQAHDGFVEILSAKPAGSVFRVALAAQS